MVRGCKRLRRHAVRCPLCGQTMKYLKRGRLFCGNPKCAVIEVRIKRDGSTRVLLDSASRRKKSEVKRENAAFNM